MKENKKQNSVVGSIFNALKIFHEADHKFVYFSFYKNITEAIFNSLYGIYLIKYIYECIENHVDFKKLFVLVSIYAIVHIIIHLTSAYHSYCMKISEMKIYRHIFSKIIHRAKKIPINQYENPDFYDNFSRALDESLEQGIWGMLFTTFGVGSILGSIVVLIILASVDVVLIAFVILPVIGSLYYGIRESSEMFAQRRDETVGKRKMEYAKRVFYEKKYASELRLFPISKVLFGIQREGYLERYKKLSPHAKKIALYRIIETALFAGLVTLGSYLYITYRLKVSGSTAVASYVAMIAAIGSIVQSISEAIEYFSQSGKLCMYMNNIREFMDCPTEDKVDHAIMPAGNMGDISFENVSYHYSGSDQMIIHNLNIHVKKGEHIALVGENVLMKSPETDRERQLVIDSLNKAQFGEVLERLPDGIDTYLTKEFDENGFVCSGGQAQKIAIARVFAKNPDVVILDEPSSALDPIAEYNMYCNMMEASEGKTVFFISHRMSSARMADRILFLEHGKIVEEGSHEQLMEKNGRYASMFHLQAQNYQDEMGGGLYA